MWGLPYCNKIDFLSQKILFPDAGCQNKRKLCLCDGLCGMSCVRPEKECPELPDPDHGQVHLTGRHFQVEIETYKDTAEKYSPL